MDITLNQAYPLLSTAKWVTGIAVHLALKTPESEVRQLYVQIAPPIQGDLVLHIADLLQETAQQQGIHSLSGLAKILLRSALRTARVDLTNPEVQINAFLDLTDEEELPF